MDTTNFYEVKHYYLIFTHLVKCETLYRLVFQNMHGLKREEREMDLTPNNESAYYYYM